MPKKSKTKRILKIIGGVIIFFTLPTLLFFGFMYLKYNEDLPDGQQGPKADQLATRMLEALNEDAYRNTDYLEWTFKGIHHYKWYKTDKTCEVSWGEMTVILDLQNQNNSKVFAGKQEYNGKEKYDYILKAESYFNNDSFWLVAPYKVFDVGTERRLVITEEDKDALLVTYTSGGSTPGDSYLWHLDDNGKPKSFQMWVDILPIGGLEATWNDWLTTESSAILPKFHKLLFLSLDMGEVKGLRF
ncbi:hypothetical protein [Winogradskyella flava]|uniref:Uncharacterized protein n=1 Tax=Winogradskyella flava TaxID=1884876 RepID=A0A842J1C4_9FLAO|nr:hypothetical protein [Winogradskyella flava]MBC2846768.1 hypothetical protein [Winogradskyella flava]